MPKPNSPNQPFCQTWKRLSDCLTVYQTVRPSFSVTDFSPAVGPSDRMPVTASFWELGYKSPPSPQPLQALPSTKNTHPRAHSTLPFSLQSHICKIHPKVWERLKNQELELVLDIPLVICICYSWSLAPNRVVKSRKVCITLLVRGFDSWTGFDLGGCSGEKRVETDPVLCGLLNGDVESFVDSNFGIKSCVSCSSYKFRISYCSNLELLRSTPCCCFS